MTTNLDRRAFLKMSAGAAAGLSISSFAAVGGGSAMNLLSKPIPAYTSWKDVFRKQWTWDKVVKGTHIVNCWYQAHCSWDVYVKDGLVFREEQSAQYEKVNDELPDYNPRGCQKGGCYSEKMYDPTRVTHPMRRVGLRGGGKWERVSWEDALTDLANTWLDVATEEGTDRVVWDLGPAADTSQSTGALSRASGLTQSINLDCNTEIGDGHRGTGETFGKICIESSADDFFYSDLILFWAGNPLYTQIPNAHFFTEAKYRGARIISISPDYNASAMKSDIWIHIKPATDAALAMGVAHLLVKDGKIAADFVREQTDMPLLVREDNQHFLCDADIREGGKADQFFVFDENTQNIAPLPRTTLKLGKLHPTLTADSQVTLKDGRQVRVRTVFDRLRDRLVDYTPEKVAEICGTTPLLVMRLAQEISAAKRMKHCTQSTYSKQYHGNLAERAVILLFALTGQIGHKGAGVSGFPMLYPDGFDDFVGAASLDELSGKKISPMRTQMMKIIGPKMTAGDTLEIIISELVGGMYQSGKSHLSSGTMFWHVHGGVSELSDNAPDWNRHLKRSVKDHLKEAIEKNWQPCSPPPGKDPRMLFSIFSNPFRRIRGSQKLDEVLLPKLKKYVVLDSRMNSSGRMADYVLPVTSWYENTNFKWVTPLSPYLTVSVAATKPLGQAKNDWEIIFLLVKKIQEQAIRRGIDKVKTPHGQEIDFSKVYDALSMDGALSETGGEMIVKHMFEKDKQFKDMSWERFKEKGVARFTKLPNNVQSIGNQCDFPSNDSIVALTNHVVKKAPYPTTTRRIQFYLDHPLYHEYDEVLPRHKAPPTLGGDYPLMLTGGKTRWSIHSSWRDSQIMMRLSRPEPYVLISSSDAAQRGIKDHDKIRVHNDVAEFEANAMLAPALQPGQALMYHAWERYQFRSKGDMNSPSPSPLNPVELAGGIGQHLAPGAGFGQASMFDRETRVEIERLGAA